MVKEFTGGYIGDVDKNTMKKICDFSIDIHLSQIKKLEDDLKIKNILKELKKEDITSCGIIAIHEDDLKLVLEKVYEDTFK